MINRILILCIGNICRSPMAEGLLKKALPGRAVSSAGMSAVVGHPADPHAIALMQQQGIDITPHRAQQLENWMIGAADMVLVMDMEQKRHLELLYPACRGKTFRLGEHGKYDIPDPYRHGLAAFRDSAALIQQGAAAWTERIQAVTEKVRAPNPNILTTE